MIERMEDMLSYDLLYYLHGYRHSHDELKQILYRHNEIKFVSLVAVDLGGNDTDEKIPIDLFLEDIEDFLSGSGVQTDGSSVVLPGIASLNDGKVNLVPDSQVKWFVDYNYANIDPVTKKPVGTLRIPSFLSHKGRWVDSRSTLERSIQHFKSEITALLRSYPAFCQSLGLEIDDIEEVLVTSATELEFWVQTPEDQANIKALSASQLMKEQYWKRTKGLVRTALERSLVLLDLYGLDAEMGHKEVGGVKAQVTAAGDLTHVMEQLEIDWKYDRAMQTADNELLARTKVKEVFQNHGLDVSFRAKPIPEIAGNGEHTHISVSLKTKKGKLYNLFSPKDMEKDYLSVFGWGALMGVLKNYEVINPFISATNDALARLRPGFEAPVCIVSSIGQDVTMPSRNRTVLVGLIRDLENPLATRLEIRSPNPHTNTYLTLAALIQSALDGIKACLASEKSSPKLLKEFSKKPQEEGFYLEKDRQYRSEEEVFESYSQAERDQLFGHHPATVWENIQQFDLYPDKLIPLLAGGVFRSETINSFSQASLDRWMTEIVSVIIPKTKEKIQSMTRLHDPQTSNQLDKGRWIKIQEEKESLSKDDLGRTCLLGQLKEAVEEKDLDQISQLQKETEEAFSRLKDLYLTYKGNII